MSNRARFMLLLLLLSLSLSAPCAAKARHIHGTVVAYDPAYHILKESSFVRNLEVVIVELSPAGKSPSFIKVVFEGFGPTQIEQDVLDGVKPLDTWAVRDGTCDEARPRLVTKFNLLGNGSGTFLMNSSRVKGQPPQIDRLRCFRVKQDDRRRRNRPR